MFVTEEIPITGSRRTPNKEANELDDYLDLPGLIANMAMVLEIQRVSI